MTPNLLNNFELPPPVIYPAAHRALESGPMLFPHTRATRPRRGWHKWRSTKDPSPPPYDC
eukprot:15451016-Alexandrium_andersonii.AAC.1